MWIVYAIFSSFFAGITAILAKCGIKRTDSTVATAIRTSVVFIFAWIIVLITGAFSQFQRLSSKTLIFLVLSGLSTGASWLCYFRALQIGDVNKIVPIDKSSTILTIILAIIFLNEDMTWWKGFAIFLMSVGIILMTMKSKCETTNTQKSNSWLIFAILSAIFASLTSILSKIGISEIDSNLGTAIRTTIVLVMAWLMVPISKKCSAVIKINKKELLFICLSGLATGISWLCFYRALKDGTTSAVISIDKLSIIVTIIFSRIVFREKLSFKALIGLILILLGTIFLVIL